MPIPVICPKCHKRFSVSEKFAGKSGPCPVCKTTIQVPEEVKIHTPEAFASGGKTVSGKLATKPIARTEVRVQPVTAAIITAIAVGIVVLAAAAGKIWDSKAEALSSYLVAAIGLLLVSPALVLAAYSFLRDDEFEPYRGGVLYLRAGICAAGYALLWPVFSYVANVWSPLELWNWVVLAPAFLIVGALVSLGSLDLDFGSGFFHYAFYVVVTILLRGIAGMGWVWDIGKG